MARCSVKTEGLYLYLHTNLRDLNLDRRNILKSRCSGFWLCVVLW